MTEHEAEATMYLNLNAPKPAHAARYLYSAEYSSSGLGCWEFWARLEERRKKVCRNLVRDIEQARPEDAPASS